MMNEYRRKPRRPGWSSRSSWSRTREFRNNPELMPLPHPKERHETKHTWIKYLPVAVNDLVDWFHLGIEYAHKGDILDMENQDYEWGLFSQPSILHTRDDKRFYIKKLNYGPDSEIDVYNLSESEQEGRLAMTSIPVKNLSLWIKIGHPNSRLSDDFIFEEPIDRVEVQTQLEVVPVGSNDPLPGYEQRGDNPFVEAEKLISQLAN